MFLAEVLIVHHKNMLKRLRCLLHCNRLCLAAYVNVMMECFTMITNSGGMWIAKLLTEDCYNKEVWLKIIYKVNNVKITSPYSTNATTKDQISNQSSIKM